jgi:hypothetical protein
MNYRYAHISLPTMRGLNVMMMGVREYVFHIVQYSMMEG